MKHENSTKTQARKLYIQGLNFSEIADALNINAKTVSVWKSDDKSLGIDWDKTRAISSKENIEHLSLQMLNDLLILVGQSLKALKDDDGFVIEKVDALSKLMDSYNKGVSSCQKLMPEVNKNQAILWVIENLAEHIAKNNSDLLPSFLQASESFVEQID